MDIFDLFATSDLLEESGKFFDLAGAKFRIARIGNSRYLRMLNAEFEKHRETLEMKGEGAQEIVDACSKGIMQRVYARTVLLGWEGDVKFGGRSIQYSFEDAEDLLKIKDFFAWVDGKAKNFQNYLLSAQQEDAKNSETTTSGSSSGVVASNSSNDSNETQG